MGMDEWEETMVDDVMDASEASLAGRYERHTSSVRKPRIGQQVFLIIKRIFLQLHQVLLFLLRLQFSL